MEGQEYLITARRRGVITEEARDSARRAFTESSSLDPTLAEAHAALGELAFYAQETVDAERHARRAIAIDKENYGAQRLLARVLFLRANEEGSDAKGGMSKAAITQLREVARLNSKEAEAWALLGELYERSGKLDEAINAYKQWAETSAPLDANIYEALTGGELTDVAAYTRLGQALANNLRFTEAIAAYEAALRAKNIGSELLNSDEAKLFANNLIERILELQRTQQDWKAAEATTARLRLLLGDSDPGVDLQTIDNLRAQGKSEEALQAIRAAHKRHPQRLDFTQREAAVLTDLGRVEEGAALLEKPGRENSDPFIRRLYIANIYTQAGRPREAVAAAEQALQLAGTSQQGRETAALLILASARERAGDSRGAEEALRRVLAHDPQNATALNNLGYFFVEKGIRLEEALTLIERAIHLDPFNASFLDSRGWAFFKLGRYAEAAHQLAEAARRNPASATIQEHLGDAYHRLGKADEARAAWQRALQVSSRPPESERLKMKLDNNLK
jgi:tetratricopeptide (TPR) repeat protein